VSDNWQKGNKKGNTSGQKGNNISESSEHMTAFLLCENHLNPSIYPP